VHATWSPPAGLAAGALDGARVINVGPVVQISLGGTPLYMAPEQACGEPVDFRAYVYALSATLFHLVAGRPPFEDQP
jgi:serine/threonine protein kinase